jgi:hypothetical protein
MKKLIPMINEAGTHSTGRVTRKCDAVLADGVIVKKGTDDDHVAVTTAATENPLGLTMNATDAAEGTVGIELFSSPGTKVATASGAVAVNDRVCAAAAGAAAKLSATGGTYFVIGRAITAAADGVKFEFEGCVPYSVVVS